MKRTRFIYFASSLFICASFSSCNKQTVRTSFSPQNVSGVTAQHPSRLSSHTWNTLSWENCNHALLSGSFVASTFHKDSPTMKVSVEESNECKGLYRVSKLHDGRKSTTIDTDVSFVINASDPNRVVIERQTILVAPNEYVEIESAAAHLLNKGIPAIIIEDAGLFGVYRDDEIVFPDKNFVICATGNEQTSEFSGDLKLVMPRRVTVAETMTANK